MTADLDRMIAERAQRARDWLFLQALPLWSAKSYDAQARCFHERLNDDGSPALEPRRVRVQARQTAVFAIAGKVGWTGPWREQVEAGVRVIRERCLRLGDGSHHTLGVDGAPLDTRSDLYDLAFILFALAEAAGALGGRGDLIETANDQIKWIDTKWAHPSGGFSEGEVAPSPPRRQNPHMHLFEALLALHEISGDTAYLQRAQRLAVLGTTKFYDPSSGVLREYFEGDWRPAAGEAGQTIEPGHMFEWSWLLDRYARLSGGAPHAAIAHLRETAEACGVDHATGRVYAECRVDRTIVDARSRLWMHTERLKANLVAWERTGAPDAGNAAAQSFDCIMSYCDAAAPGLWRDRWALDGRFVEEPAPASSFYHIMLALAALLPHTKR